MIKKKLESWRKLWQSKIAEAGEVSRNDPRITNLFNDALPAIFKRDLDIKTFEIFKVDKAFLEEFKKFPVEQRAREAELQDYKEESRLKFLEWMEVFKEGLRADRERIAGRARELERIKGRLDTYLIEDWLFENPDWWAKRNWLAAHHRWDGELDDAGYEERLRYDMTHWGLPRNP